jgi:hypothetical protein
MRHGHLPGLLRAGNPFASLPASLPMVRSTIIRFGNATGLCNATRLTISELISLQASAKPPRKVICLSSVTGSG